MTADVNAATPLHNHAGYFRALKKKGIKTYSVNPLVTDTAAYMNSEWIAPNPGTDCALMAAMMYELEVTGKADHAFLAKYCSGWEEMKKYLLGEEDGVKRRRSGRLRSRVCQRKRSVPLRRTWPHTAQ